MSKPMECQTCGHVTHTGILNPEPAKCPICGGTVLMPLEEDEL